ncbi:TetR/AcrR family transcriptional regulator, partial [Micrococcus luteus]|nr:TetR/AcrR family transcriptional regulator [Micrococcus luteus]MCV7521365.1 TetR/AcrR family transcriptional regulator [Micrococcus luteus]
MAGNLREAVEAGDVVPMIDIQILIEVRLLTVVMDGIGLQRLLDPSTDISVAVTACVNRAL